ncbi:hypothetical protein EVAR_33478_1 [Eumeta japonica]|uniref:Uncharacterized protein n=1 Tax=Eumeta variegata TaxID=151549 RepID=A0A4C1WHY7_EUMVA|nr:hypothetical protein EVAR_33478_1 [Eumeta japonica]
MLNKNAAEDKGDEPGRNEKFLESFGLTALWPPAAPPRRWAVNERPPHRSFCSSWRGGISTWSEEDEGWIERRPFSAFNNTLLLWRRSGLRLRRDPSERGRLLSSFGARPCRAVTSPPYARPLTRPSARVRFVRPRRRPSPRRRRRVTLRAYRSGTI